MVQYTEFMSIGMNKCGTDNETFSELARIWSENKTEIENMSRTEAENELVCP